MVLVKKLSGGSNANGDKIQDYINALGAGIRANIETTHKYEVKVDYGTSGLVNTITITE